MMSRKLLYAASGVSLVLLGLLLAGFASDLPEFPVKAVPCLSSSNSSVSPPSGRRTPEPPPEYAGKSNPLPGNKNQVKRGKQLYLKHCSTCHGPSGRGNGPAAKALSPAPRNFAGTNFVNRHADDYLYWRISEGKPDTAMPSFNHILSPVERWRIIQYLRRIGGGSGR